MIQNKGIRKIMSGRVPSFTFLHFGLEHPSKIKAGRVTKLKSRDKTTCILCIHCIGGCASNGALGRGGRGNFMSAGEKKRALGDIQCIGEIF